MGAAFWTKNVHCAVFFSFFLIHSVLQVAMLLSNIPMFLLVISSLHFAFDTFRVRKIFPFATRKKMLNFNIIIIISFSEFHKHKMENVSLFHIFVWQTTHFSRIFFSMSSYKEEGKKILFCSDTTLFSWWFIFQTFLKWNCHFHLPKMVLIPI